MKLLHIGVAAIAALAFTIAISAPAQNVEPPETRLGSIMGTVMDVNGDTVPGATIVLQGSDADDRRTLTTAENGLFHFRSLSPAIPYSISITAKGFADWTSPTITLEPGQAKIVTDIQLRIPAQLTSVQVTYNPVVIATEQLKAEEKQRVLGIIPNFYVSYESNPEPLTAKMKFRLAMKVSTDPVTAAGVLFMAGVWQTADTPNYGQGWDAYGKRVGATATNGFSDIMVGGAILPSLLHQDPRYFYQGSGTSASRIRHAVFSPFVTRNDNGNWGPNYSSVGGDLASAALSNLYYPKSDRGAGLVFGTFAIGTAERIGASLAQEFLIGKLTQRGGHVK